MSSYSDSGTLKPGSIRASSVSLMRGGSYRQSPNLFEMSLSA